MAFWTHYGMWDDAGLRVIGPWGNVIYRLSDAAEARIPARKALLARLDDGVGLPGVVDQLEPLSGDDQQQVVVVQLR